MDERTQKPDEPRSTSADMELAGIQEDQPDIGLCDFCSLDLPKNESTNFYPVGVGRSLDEIVECSKFCLRCKRLSEALRKYECRLHDFGGGDRLDICLLSGDASSPNRTTEAPSSEPPPVLSQDMVTCLRTCLATHELCWRGIDRSWVPTRLIDIHGGKPEAPVPKLVHRANVSLENFSYLALSYRWLQVPVLTLTRGNLKTLERRIPPSTLRQVFRDAMDITRQLGARYLWIDSLCIIQDSPEDWNQESALMSLVYANAIVTLSESGATEPGSLNGFSLRRFYRYDKGLFKYQQSYPPKPLTITLGMESVDHGTPHKYDNVVIANLHCKRPLEDRGWVLQEHYLASRTIHFARPLTWECRQMVAKVIDRRLIAFPADMSKKVSASTLNQGEIHNIWARIVTDYSKCDLTKEDDKLVAISGLARVVGSVLGTNYAAGHWIGGSLTRSLLWETTNDDSRRVGAYRAPSWSWASVNGEVRFQSLMDETIPLATVTSVETKNNTTDKFGRVKAGHMDVDGRLIMLGMTSGHSSRQKLYGDHSIRVSLDDILQSDTGRLFLLPLFRRKADQFYWSLLLAEKPETKYFVRRGLVTVSLENEVSTSLSSIKLQLESTDWEHVFYPHRSLGNQERFFTVEDFESSEIQSVRLL
ncbi:heterokaryon incompatibility protein-domain-containing protein [Hypomontagnella monticulosa]|nr:heterokaryon incompatibility protein-domain-containing protein [Hypomontagnella monticulosa]